jgi:riboflavin synthase
VFTGVIREYANVTSFSNELLTLKCDYIPMLGDSIAINGACLSVVEVLKDGFVVELSLESRDILAIENYKGKVHIEPAMRLQDRVDGHLVQGHIDGIGKIVKIESLKRAKNFYIETSKNLLKFMVPKGSVTIDGVSLTINDVLKDSFRLTIIPLTLDTTLLGEYHIGKVVNIEADMFAKYIYHISQNSKPSITSWADVDNIMARY